MVAKSFVKSAMTISVLLFCTACAQSAKVEKIPKIGMANPASVHCANLNGSTKLTKEPEGQVGWCQLPNGKICQEWPLFRDNKCVAPNAQQLKQIRQSK